MIFDCEINGLARARWGSGGGGERYSQDSIWRFFSGEWKTDSALR